MPPDFASEEDLLDRLTAQPEDFVFLVGSAVTAPECAGEPGVPRAEGILEEIRRTYTRPEELERFEQALVAAPAQRFQAAFRHLQITRGPDQVNAVIRRCVLQARVPSSRFPVVPDIPEGATELCRSLEQDLDGWHLPPAVEALGQLMASRPAGARPVVLTSNFDPLVTVSVHRAGGRAFTTALHSDGGFVAIDGQGTLIVHFHGDWCRSDTLHTPAQIGQDRPRLAASLSELLGARTLVVLGYGGRDDIFTRSLVQVIRGETAAINVLWTFFDADSARLSQDYAGLLANLGPGIERGRVTLYKGIDAHAFLPRLARTLGLAAPTTAADSTTGGLGPAESALNRSSAMSYVPHAPELPSASTLSWLVGRDELLAKLVEHLRKSTSTPVAVLGPPGIGKSILTVAALHHPAIIERFGRRRFFARLGAAVSTGEVLGAIGAALNIPAVPDLERAIQRSIKAGPALLVLDDADDACAARDDLGMEELLYRLCQNDELALVLSWRGTSRPPAAPWEVYQVKPLTDDTAKCLFCNIAGDVYRRDVKLDDLLLAQGGVPLALYLLALAAEGRPVSVLQKAWNESRSKLLKRPGAGKTKNDDWEVSIELSIHGRRMSESARRLMRILAWLPDGISEVDLPHLRRKGLKEATILSQVGLAYFAGQRLLMLAPIRTHIAMEHPASPDERKQIIAYYRDLAPGLRKSVDTTEGVVARVISEAANIDICLQASLGMGRTLREKAIDATIAYSSFARSSGRLEPCPIVGALATARALDDANRELACTVELARIKAQTCEIDIAAGLLSEALALAEKQKKLRTQADCLEMLASISFLQANFATGTRYLQRAADILTRSGSHDEADRVRRQFADPNSNTNDPDDPRITTELKAAEKAGNLRVQAQRLRWIGDAACGRSLYERAESAYTRASQIFEKMDALGDQAYCDLRRAYVCKLRGDLSGALAAASTAFSTYCAWGNRTGAARALHELGQLAARNRRPAEARAHYEDALDIWESLGSTHEVVHLHGHLFWLASGPRQAWFHARGAWQAMRKKQPSELEPYLDRFVNKRVLLRVGVLAGVVLLLLVLVLWNA